MIKTNSVLVMEPEIVSPSPQKPATGSYIQLV